MKTLKERYEALKAEAPKLRIRNAAEKLNVSELELLAMQLGDTAKLLKSEPHEILLALEPLGELMALTRNDYAVHERRGIYSNVSFMGDARMMGLAVNPDIDLRLFMNRWKYVFAVTMKSRGKMLYSIQFFDVAGDAVHKVYSTKKTNLEAYHQLVENFKAEDQSPEFELNKTPVEKPEYARDEEVDLAAYQADWEALEDTHDFFGMLKKYKLARQQALRLAPAGYCEKVDNQTVIRMLEMASNRAVPIMVFLNNKSCIQIHSGPVKKLFEMEAWYNVMDPQFNLHLNMNGVVESWIVRKNTKDGIVTSLELFDKDGELITYFFGARKPGIPELEGWREIVADLSKEKVEG